MLHRILDDPKYSEPGDQPVPDTYKEDTNMYNHVLTIECKCGYTILEDTICPFCGRVYLKCDICGLWVAEEDICDGICDECMLASTDIDYE